MSSYYQDNYNQDNYNQDHMLYNVDIVLCIDCTESMDNVLTIVKDRALSFHADLQGIMNTRGMSIDRLRVRLIAFRDYLAYEEELQKHTHLNEPMLESDFFVLPDEADKLSVSVRSLQPAGGGDEPEDGLEALAYAIRSPWTVDAFKNRHVIALWTDQEPHPLGFGMGSSRYPRGMARNFDELTEWWGDWNHPGFMPNQSAKRLLLFAPDSGAWQQISDTWDNVLHFPSRAGDHLRDIDYQGILSGIAQTIA